jgi:hypothetical protein
VELSGIIEKTGNFVVNFGGSVGFCGKNKGRWVGLEGLGKIGKKKAFENVQKPYRNL